MAGSLLSRSLLLVRFLACLPLLASVSAALGQDAGQVAGMMRGVDAGLVRVHLRTETRGPKEAVEINGTLLTDASPIIIQTLSSTGIVLDGKGHIMTFLGYNWLDIHDRDPKIEVRSGDGARYKGRLVGIDHSNGVAVVKLTEGKLSKTRICDDCEIRGGLTVMAPAAPGPQISVFQEAQVLSVGAGPRVFAPGGLSVKVNRPFPDIDQPILDRDHRVIGFVASQDPMGMQNVVLPIKPLLASADKIVKQGGDVLAGWLGVFPGLVQDSQEVHGVVVQRIEPDSPAAKAGLSVEDILTRYNGQRIKDPLQLIRLVEETPIGSQADIELVRGGKTMMLAAAIESRRQRPSPLSFARPGVFGTPAPGASQERKPRLLVGLDAIVLHPALAETLQMPGQNGLLVVDVIKGLPADRAGAMVGDVIVAMDGRVITDLPGFVSHLQQLRLGSLLSLKVLRKGRELNLTVQLPAQGD